MTFEVTPAIKEIKIGAEEIEEILQNVAIIIATPKGSVPLDREFGVDYSFLDTPTPKALALFRAEVVKAIEKYESRVKVLEVDFCADPGSPEKLLPKVFVEILI